MGVRMPSHIHQPWSHLSLARVLRSIGSVCVCVCGRLCPHEDCSNGYLCPDEIRLAQIIGTTQVRLCTDMYYICSFIFIPWAPLRAEIIAVSSAVRSWRTREVSPSSPPGVEPTSLEIVLESSTAKMAEHFRLVKREKHHSSRDIYIYIIINIYYIYIIIYYF